MQLDLLVGEHPVTAGEPAGAGSGAGSVQGRLPQLTGRRDGFVHSQLTL